MTIYRSEIIDNSCVIYDPRGNFVGYVPSQIVASRLLNRLNGPRTTFTFHDYGKVCEIQCEGELVLSTRRMSLNPKEKPLTKIELETYVAHLNRFAI
jgi:hypothetical protein